MPLFSNLFYGAELLLDWLHNYLGFAEYPNMVSTHGVDGSGNDGLPSKC